VATAGPGAAPAASAHRCAGDVRAMAAARHVGACCRRGLRDDSQGRLCVISQSPWSRLLGL
jgi:transposase